MQNVIPEGMEIPIRTEEELEQRRERQRAEAQERREATRGSLLLTIGIAIGAIGAAMMLWQLTQEVPNQAIFGSGFTVTTLGLVAMLRGTR